MPKKGSRKRSYRQTGRSVKHIDKKLHAKKPGTRTSLKGRTYTERRANRSDKGRWL